jgi:putative membrane protein (TIGR04086 family)
MISGFKIGKQSEKRGYLSGIIIGSLNIILILLLALIFRSIPELKSLIYFMILLLSSTIGGMFGINKKKN